MNPDNPLVAPSSGASVDPWAGIWLAEDIETILAGVKGGSWIDTAIGDVSAGLDALAFVSDPIGSLLQYGVAWIIEHVKPLSEALDWLSGDPGQIAAHAQTWRNVAVALRDRADDLERAVRWDTDEWTGAAAEAYRTWTEQQKDAVGGLASAAETMAAITEGAGFLIALTVGFATPALIEQVSTE